MVLSARKKAFAFSALLILISSGLVVSAAATTESVLRPFQAGKEFGQERSLSRHAVALAVIVGDVGEEGRERVQGAFVTVLDADGATAATATTDEKGRAIFHLRRGVYNVTVEADGNVASKEFRLAHSQRIFVGFDADGQPHWFKTDNHEMERRGDTATLTVLVRDQSNGTDAPASNATVRILHQGKGRDGEVANATTGPRGAAVLHLHKGRYVVEVTYQGQNATTGVALAKDHKLAVIFDGDGARVRGGKEPGRPASTPADDGKRPGFALGVRVLDGRANESDANVTVYFLKQAKRGEWARGDVAGQAMTGENGTAVFRLRAGPYEVVAQAQDGRTVSERVRLHEDQRLRLELPAEAE